MTGGGGGVYDVDYLYTNLTVYTVHYNYYISFCLHLSIFKVLYHMGGGVPATFTGVAGM